MKDLAGVSHHVTYSPYVVRGVCDYDGPGPDPDPIPVERELFKGNDIAGVPDECKLYPNQPNPFNPATAIRYDVPAAGHVTIDVINIMGQKVATLVDQIKSPGSYETLWNGIADDGRKVSSGIYLYIMRSGDYLETRKMMLLK